MISLLSLMMTPPLTLLLACCVHHLGSVDFAHEHDRVVADAELVASCSGSQLDVTEFCALLAEKGG